MKRNNTFVLLALVLASVLSFAQDKPIEVHNQLAPKMDAPMRVALTLDACSGKYDSDLIEFLIRNRIPVTIFATKKWLDHNPTGVTVIKAHLDLFDVENHGENHIPAVIGRGRKVYGIPGEPDLIHLRREVTKGHAQSNRLSVSPPNGIAVLQRSTICRLSTRYTKKATRLPAFPSTQMQAQL
jgi:peptidoglycan/xylan/chitin deacetylase (PgdA/CDA1 family)